MYKITLDGARLSSANYKTYENARKALRRLLTMIFQKSFDGYTQFGFKISKT